jgi:hypothetical protein
MYHLPLIPHADASHWPYVPLSFRKNQMTMLNNKADPVGA